MRVGVNLHTHEATASPDSATPAAHMADVYCNNVADFTLLGYVGHDRLPSPRRLPRLSLLGVEHSVDWGGREVHVVRFPGHDFSFLAHPGMTFAKNVRMQALEVVQELDLDGVEKYNAGRRQYRGSVATLELAGDDAHSPMGVGRSFMLVDVDTVSVDAIMREVSHGRFEVVNHLRPLRGLVHLLEKAACVTAERLTSLPGTIQYGSKHPRPRRE